MTKLESLEAKLNDLADKFTAFVTGKSKTTPAATPENPNPEAVVLDPAEIQASLTAVEGLKGEVSAALAEAKTATEAAEKAKTEAEKAKTDFEAKSKKADEEFEAKVDKAAAAKLLAGATKPLAQSNDDPAKGKVADPVDGITGVSRVAAAMKARKEAATTK